LQTLTIRLSLSARVYRSRTESPAIRCTAFCYSPDAAEQSIVRPDSKGNRGSSA
jgi:hypothetical protein